MSRRFLASISALAVMIAVTVVVVGAQIPTTSAKKPSATKTWTPSHTPDGQPDLQGTWTNATLTPFERPTELAGKPFLTEAEAAALEANYRGSFYANTFGDPGIGTIVSTRRTSLVVDPPDGRAPIRPEAEKRRDSIRDRSSDALEYMTMWDRCITRGVPGAIFPTLYNNGYQILQAPGYVAIVYEMIHDARIIPLDGRPHVGPNIRQWMGDSRGHWEGQTLVVDTTNFNGKGTIATHEGAGRLKGTQQSQLAHVVERFTRVDASTIKYEGMIDDPEVYTQPWRWEIPLTRDPNYHLYEYACHEGNATEIELILGEGPGAEAAARQKRRGSR